MSVLNRREFLQAAGIGAALGASPLASFAQAAGSAQDFSSYRALVCVYLLGGNDSFNMVIPRSTAEYNAYSASRQNMAVAKSSLLSIAPQNPDGASYGLHPSLPELRALFSDGQAAFINNIGPMVQPVTKEQYLSQTIDVPPRLFSHNSQMEQWQSLQGMSPATTGWAGRIADLLRTEISGQLFPVNISLHGNQLMNTGDATTPYVMGPDGPAELVAFGDTVYQQDLRQAYERVLAASHNSIYERGFVDVQQRALETVETISSAIAAAQPVTVNFSNSDLSRQLRSVANLISARAQLKMKRQIFFVGVSGFDTHDDQLQFHPGLLADLSRSIGDFYKALEQLDVADKVTLFTESDFGRTLTSNGDGTDHGWGGIQVAVGGAVEGGRFYGTYPELSMGGPDEVSGGRLLPTTSADQYIATLSKWFGINDVDMQHVVPNLGNFAASDLGFMA